MVSGKSIERLSLYRRILGEILEAGVDNVYSHQLASGSGGTAAQVRRDLMVIGYSGSPKMGYSVEGLIKSINDFLGPAKGSRAVLIGMGNLGRALLTYFRYRPIGLSIEAIFDVDESKINRTIAGCQCYHIDDMVKVVSDISAKVAILSVPAQAAQSVADQLIEAGIRGLMNFAPIRLQIPENVYVEYVDMTVASEKVAYFANLYDSGIKSDDEDDDIDDGE